MVTTAKLVDNGSGKAYLTATQLLDAFGRVRQVQTQAYPSPGNTAGGRTVADTYYDSHGWTIRTNNKWNTSGAPDSNLISTPDASVDDRTLTSYDGAGRAVLATEYHGLTATWATSTVYGGDRTTVLPPTGSVASTTVSDARGEATELDQWTSLPTVSGGVISGGTAQKTTYHNTPLGQQDQLVTAAGTSLASTWSTVFDLAGRVKSQIDPDAGASSRTYRRLRRGDQHAGCEVAAVELPLRPARSTVCRVLGHRRHRNQAVGLDLRHPPVRQAHLVHPACGLGRLHRGCDRL